MKRDALVVGINNYPVLDDNPKSKVLHLQTPAADAEAIAHTLQHHGNFRVKRLPVAGQIDALQVDPKQLVTVAELKTAIAQLFNPQGDNIPDTALLYFAGHGLRETLGGISEGYLATSDASPRKNIWGVSLQWLRRLLQESPVRQQIVWLDCCHSGELLNFDEADPGNREGRDRCFIAASRDFEVAYGSGEHGVLTNALLQALDPKRHPEGRVTTKSLVASLKQALEAVPVPQRFRHDYSGNEIILTLDRKEKSTHPAFASICPYKGLDYFKTEDHEYFYGRTALTDKLLEKVRSKNFLVVLGASGSGKSSLVRAGLLYQLQQGLKLSGSDRWQIYQPFTPGENPLQRLAEVMGKEVQTPDGKFLLEQVIKDSSGDRAVLVVDQFEEVFTLCQNNSKRQQFFDCLLDTLEQTGNKLCLVLVMRTDFLDKCLPYSRLATQLGDESTHAIVTPMTAKQLEEAIRVPASKVGLEIENALIKQILEDLGASNASGTIDGETEESTQKREPESLPLLEYTLEQLWLQPRTLDLLTLTSYQELGGVRGALRKQADAIFHELTPEEQLAARRIFVSLTQLGEGTEDTRRRVAQTGLVTAQLPAALIDRVVQKFAQKRLLVITSGSATGETEAETVSPLVEVAHEALIRHWPRLRGWLDENREMLRRQRRIDAEAKQWAENGKKPEYLLQGSRLGDAEEFVAAYPEELSNLAVELVGESQRERDRLQKERDRQRRRTILGLTSGLVIALSLTGLAGWLWQQAEIGRINTQFVADSLSIEALLNSGLDLEALEKAVRLGRQLQRSDVVQADVKMRAVAAIRRVVYGVREINRQKGDSQVKNVSFSPDGKNLVFGDGKIIKIWNLNTNKIQKLEGHNYDVKNVIISPDGKTIASASDDKTIKLWSLNGKALKTFKGHTASVNSVTFSPDGKIIASASSDKTIKIWSLDGKELQTFKGHKSRIWQVIFSPDGKTIASASGEISSSVNAAISDSLHGSDDEPFDVNSVLTEHDKDYEGGDNTIRIWSLKGIELRAFKGHSKRVNGISFSSDGKSIASASQDGTIKLWNLDGTELRAFKGHSKPVNSISFSPDGQSIASASDDGTVKLWNLDGTELQTLKGHIFGVANISFSPVRQASPYGVGKIIASTGTDNTIKIWSFSNMNLKILKEHNNPIAMVVFSPDGKLIASAGAGRKIKIRNLDSQEIKNFEIEKLWLEGRDWAGVESISFSPDSKTIISGSTDGLQLWHLDNPDRKTFRSISKQALVNSVIFSPDGKIIASDGDNNTVKVWNVEGQNLQSLKGHKDAVKSVSFSPDGSIIASASGDATIKLWSIDGKELQTLESHKDAVNSVSFSPDGSIIASASRDATIKLWSLNGRELRTIKGHSSSVYNISFSPNGKVIASAGNDGTIKLWSIEGQELQTLTGHTNVVTSISFSPDGKTLASASADGTVILWNFDLDDLLIRSCDWLYAYLNANSSLKPEVHHLCDDIKPIVSSLFLEEARDLAKSEDIEGSVANFKKALELDKNLNLNPEIESRQIASLSLIEQAKYLANSGDIENSINKFKKAKLLNNKLVLDPQKEAQKNAALALVEKGESLAIEGRIREALLTYRSAYKLDKNIKTSVKTLTSFCYFGSLQGYATTFILACEDLVKIEPEFGRYRGLRGIARAMTNNIKGAIKDFEASIKWIGSDIARATYTQESLNKLKKQRQQWIDALRIGKNPITPQEVKNMVKLVPHWWVRQ